MTRRWLIAFGAAFLLAVPAAARDWQAAMLPDQPTEFIFGYGSLINSASRNSTVGKVVPAIPVRVKAGFGYIRAWANRSSSGFTGLGLRKPKADESERPLSAVRRLAILTCETPCQSRSRAVARRGRRDASFPGASSLPRRESGQQRC
jgi:hypothetical protein